MILIGFIFYRSRGVVGRPGFRIGNRTIKRGSQVSFSVSVVESSNLCILDIIFIGSYRSVVLVLVVLVLTRPSSPKTVFVCVFYCVFGIGGFTSLSFIERSNSHLVVSYSHDRDRKSVV